MGLPWHHRVQHRIQALGYLCEPDYCTIDDPVEDTLATVCDIQANAEALRTGPENLGLSAFSAGAVTVTRANIFGFDPCAGFDFVVSSVSGGALPNGSALYQYL